MANNGRSKYILKYQGGAKMLVRKDTNVSFSKLLSTLKSTGTAYTISGG